MKLNIKKAVREAKKARIALAGPSGSGKTMSSLRVARGLVGEAGKILLLDTERSSATLYADEVEFDHADLPDYHYETFLSGIKAAEDNGYDVVVIDSLTHAWQEFLDQHGKMQGNSFANWSKITPKYNQLIGAIVNCKCHIIVTMRAKSEYAIEEKNGRQVPKKIGLGTVMRPGTEYEFDIVGMIDIDHNMTVEKTRLSHLDGRIFTKVTEDFGKEISEWLAGGVVKKPVVVSDTQQYSYDLKDDFFNLSEAQQKFFIDACLSGKAVEKEPYVYTFTQKIDKLEKYLVVPTMTLDEVAQLAKQPEVELHDS